MGLKRRSFLAGGAGLVAGPAIAASRRSDAAELLPDSPLDQSATLLRLLNAAASAGRTLRLGPGSFRVADVALPDGSRIQGEGPGTRLVLSRPAPLLRGSRLSAVTLEDLTLDGAGQAIDAKTGLLALETVETVLLRGVSVADAPGIGVSLQGCGGRVLDSSFRGLDTALYANDSRGLSITGNLVRDCANNGLLVHRSTKGRDGTIVAHNRIEGIRAEGGGLGWFGNGINVFRAGGVIVSQNSIRDCAFSFIRANSGDAVQILGNACSVAGETGIYSEFSFEGAVVSGNVVEHAANGISVVNFDQGGRLATVQGNIVRGSRRRQALEHPGEEYGFGIAAEADTALTGNVVEDCQTAGLALGYGNFLRDIACTGNVVRGCGVGISVTVAKTDGQALIAANVISGCPGGAVAGFEWERKTPGDLASGGPVPAGLSVSGNLVR